ncbi:hypothetical protein HYALB_00003782 [Hymenoscyphus albidus]|uniref:BTB domain-containing protein n=1 Tax=Hymenoscyphus albidus TaxID=595503 RepID=A0A9N9PZY9_9HELO|nr:hypothetical protein HYALB_00003782 [Hymenoscyphus albidus]
MDQATDPDNTLIRAALHTITYDPSDRDAQRPAKRQMLDAHKPLADDLPASDFVQMMHYYRECSQVTVTVNDTSYKLPKSLVCSESTFFNKAFNSGFLETEEQKLSLTECTTETFELVVQWVYRHKLIFDIASKKEKMVDLLFDFFKLADLLGLGGPFSTVISMLKTIFIDNGALLLPKHIRIAYQLPNNYNLRKLVAEACVSKYVRFLRKGGKSKVQKEMDACEGFKMDVLEGVAGALKSMETSYNSYVVRFTCPLTGDAIDL